MFCSLFGRSKNGGGGGRGGVRKGEGGRTEGGSGMRRGGRGEGEGWACHYRISRLSSRTDTERLAQCESSRHQ